MLISLDYHFLFIANLKAASTSIEAALRPFAHIALIESRFDKHLYFKDIEERFEWVFDCVNREDMLIFGVMRDPIDYVTSLFNSHSDLKFKDDSSLYTGNLSFSEFIDKWVNEQPDQVEPQYRRFLDRHGNIAANYIISYDNLEEGLQYVANRIGVPPIRLDRLNLSHQRFSRDQMSQHQLDWVLCHFKEDFRFMQRYCDRLLSDEERISCGA